MDETNPSVNVTPTAPLMPDGPSAPPPSYDEAVGATNIITGAGDPNLDSIILQDQPIDENSKKKVETAIITQPQAIQHTQPILMPDTYTPVQRTTQNNDDCCTFCLFCNGEEIIDCCYCILCCKRNFVDGDGGCCENGCGCDDCDCDCGGCCDGDGGDCDCGDCDCDCGDCTIL